MRVDVGPLRLTGVSPMRSVRAHRPTALRPGGRLSHLDTDPTPPSAAHGRPNPPDARQHAAITAGQRSPLEIPYWSEHPEVLPLISYDALRSDRPSSHSQLQARHL